ncbi:hypothetical protein RhiirC2_721737, partial [Rhizophagus irregularis]
AVLSSLFGYGFLFRNRSECPSLVEIEALSIGMELVQLESILEPILNLKDSGSLGLKTTFNHKNPFEYAEDFSEKSNNIYLMFLYISLTNHFLIFWNFPFFRQPDLKSATRSLKNIDFDDGLFFRYGRMEFSSIFEEDLHGYIAIM